MSVLLFVINGHRVPRYIPNADQHSRFLQYKQTHRRDQNQLDAQLSNGVGDRVDRKSRGRERGGKHPRTVRPSGDHVIRETVREQKPGVYQRWLVGRRRLVHAGCEC